jgi:uncharacterized membrane protein
MLQRPYAFLRSSLVAGLIALLPLGLIVIFFGWLYSLVSQTLSPITAPMGLPLILANLLVIGAILLMGLILGILLKTKPGKSLFAGLERNLLHPIPGYLPAKETLARFIGERRRVAFLSVALVDITGQNIFVTGFVTEEHEDGSKTVFVPTSPNPTSGTTYHLPSKYVHLSDVPIEMALRSVISCGSGSDLLLKGCPTLRLEQEAGA